MGTMLQILGLLIAMLLGATLLNTSEFKQPQFTHTAVQDTAPGCHYINGVWVCPPGAKAR